MRLDKPVRRYRVFGEWCCPECLVSLKPYLTEERAGEDALFCPLCLREWYIAKAQP